MRHEWSNKEKQVLLALYDRQIKEGKRPDKAIKYCANKLNRSYKSVSTTLWRLKDPIVLQEVRPSSYPIYDKALTVMGDALILGDLHAPFHDADLINKCIRAAKSEGIKMLVLGGDAIENDMMSSWGEGFADGDAIRGMSEQILQELYDLAKTMRGKAKDDLLATVQKHEKTETVSEYAEARELFKILAASFENVIWIMGNHEDRTARKLEVAFPSDDLAQLFGVSKKWKVSSYYHCRVISGGVEWQIEHPNTAGKGAAKFVANAQDTNIIMLHNHHFNITKTASGKYWAIEPGCCADLSRLRYENIRHGRSDTHVRGAVMIIDGFPHLLNDGWTDWDRI